MATNVKILLRRGLRNELSGDILSAGEMGYTTDTNQLYVGIEEALNELRFDPFANAHAVIQSWLNSADCPVSGLTVDEDLIVADIPANEIDNILDAMRNYEQTVVFNSATATFTPGEVLTQYEKTPTVLTSPNTIPNIALITTTFTLEAVAKSFTAETLDAIVTDLQADAALNTANVLTEKVGNKIKFTRIDGVELNLVFATSAAGTASAEAIGFTQNIFSVTGGLFVTGTEYTITSLGTDTLETVDAVDIVSGVEYTILVPGTTDFTTIGAADSNIGTVFTATGSGSGTGTATKVASTIQQNWEAAGAPAPLTAGSFVIGTEYKILTLGTPPTKATDFTKLGSASNTIGTTFTATSDGQEQYTAGNFSIGRVYIISDVGTTDFTLIGASSNTVGNTFTATGTGSGTGDAYFTGTGTATSVIVGSTFTASAVGTGTGIATWDNGVNTVAAVAGYGVYASGTILTSVPGSPTASDTTVTVKISEHSNFYEFEQEGGSPDNSDWRYFGTPSTPDYSALSPAVESTAITGGTDVKIGLFGNKRKNVEVITEESRNQLFANVHLKSYSASTGLRSDLFKKSLTATVEIISVSAIILQRQYEIITAGTTDFTLIGAADSNVGTKFVASAVGLGTGTVREVGTFLKYAKTDSTSFFIDYSLKQVGTSDTFVRVGTIRVINGEAITPPLIGLVKLTDDNTEIWQDDGIIGTVEPGEFSNIEFTSVIDGADMKINYTQDVGYTTEISYTVKRWTM